MTPASRRACAVFALGGNLGEPLDALRRAVASLASVLDSPRVSAVYRTAPEGGADQPEYLNAAVAGETSLSPREALEMAHGLEARSGRQRPYPGAPRTLDVDVIFVGGAVVDDADLRVPHPRWADRDFVVLPLLDIVPDFRDPQTGRTVREVAEAAGWLGSILPTAVVKGGLLHPET